MKPAPPFASPLASAFQSFIAWKRMTGCRVRVEETRLRAWDRFLQGRLANGAPLGRELVEGWLASHEQLCGNTRREHFHLVSSFCRFLYEKDPRTFVPPAWSRPRSSQTRAPHLYSRQEITALLAAAKQLAEGRTGLLRAKAYHAVFWLLASTGLRVSEALKLTVADVDLEADVLWVRETKFRKSRLVPVTPGTSTVLREYSEACQRAGLPRQPDSPFFVSRRRRAYSYGIVQSTFVSVLRMARVRTSPGTGPRLHDLRHTFAVRRLLTWYRSGDDVMARLPLLSTYLGHAKMSDTATYLHITPELLEEADRRFRAFTFPLFAEARRDEG